MIPKKTMKITKNNLVSDEEEEEVDEEEEEKEARDRNSDKKCATLNV